MDNKILFENLRCIPDFPIPGIQFQDINPLMGNPECVKVMRDSITELYRDKGITKIVGLESRGFVMSSAVAVELNAGVVLCRKKGKLPGKVIGQAYKKEYGEDSIEIQEDAISENDIVLLHDDVLATGGTMRAAYNLVKKFNPKKIYINFIMELLIEGLSGRSVFDKDTEITTLMVVDK